MIHSIATRKITAFLSAIAWLALVVQGTSYGQPPVAEGKMYWTALERGIHRSSLDGTNVEQLVKPELRYPADIALDLLRGKMYWMDRWGARSGIYWSDLDGSNLKPFMDDDYRSVGVTNIALDVEGGKIYWTSVVSDGAVLDGWVARANLDGSNSEVLFERLPWDIALDLVQGKVYWTDGGAIFRANLDGSNLEYDFIRTDSPNIWEFALDMDGDKIYWTGWTDRGTIQRADLDGQNIEEVLTVSDGYPKEITLDLERGKVYWTNPGTQTIQRADLDGQNVEHLFDLEYDVHLLHQNIYSGPRTGIALDMNGGKIYWTDSGPGTIQRADFDGQNREVLFDPIVRAPYGIALDMDKMYWTDEVKGTIQRADFDGQNIEVLITGLNRPKRIALLEGNKIYWTDEGTRKYRGRFRAEPETGKIQAANLDGSNIEDVLTGLSYPNGIALDAVQGKIYWSLEHTIQRANLDGSNVEDVIPKLGDTFRPFRLTAGIALDVLAGKIYWRDADGKAIQRAELDGSNVEDIATLSQGEWVYCTAFALDLIGNKIYWSTLVEAPAVGEWGTTIIWEIWAEEIFRSNLDGSNVEEIGKVPVSPTDIILDISHPTATSTPDATPTIPTTSGLSPNFPNPFNASTQITYDIASPGLVRLTIYNTLGQPVRTLVDQSQPAGSYQVRWDARDLRGTALAAGVYLVRLHYPGGEQTRRLLLLK